MAAPGSCRGATATPTEALVSAKKQAASPRRTVTPAPAKDASGNAPAKTPAAKTPANKTPARKAPARNAPATRAPAKKAPPARAVAKDIPDAASKAATASSRQRWEETASPKRPPAPKVARGRHNPATIWAGEGNRTELYELGRRLRKVAPRTSHAGFEPPDDRADPIAVIEATNRRRLPELVPIRWGRMLDSPFTFYRGAPAVLARDLSRTPGIDVNVQACGDAHLLNFGLFATPERRLSFDVNDFDETLPAPWEWDIKRLSASVVVAARSVGLDEQAGKDAAANVARAYRQAMDDFRQMDALDIWYTKVDVDDIMGLLRPEQRKRASKSVERARRHTNLQALDRLTEVDPDGERHIIDQPPTLVRLPVEGHEQLLQNVFQRYVDTLTDDRQYLLGRYDFVDFALKVVGVGSVGTRCFVALLANKVDNSPLFLQVKEAEHSVLAPFVGPSAHANHGERVVCGQRLMQSASDIFLGWTNYRRTHFYLRQLRDMKGSADIASMKASNLVEYAGLCAITLARAHARTVPPSLISGYLGTNETFDDAIVKFSVDYADQNERDYTELVDAVRSGRVEAEKGV